MIISKEAMTLAMNNLLNNKDFDVVIMEGYIKQAEKNYLINPSKDNLKNLKIAYNLKRYIMNICQGFAFDLEIQEKFYE